MDSKTYTVDEAAAILGVSRDAVYRGVIRGDFPAPVLRLGGRILIPREPLDLLLRGKQPGSDEGANHAA